MKITINIIGWSILIGMVACVGYMLFNTIFKI